MSAAPSGLRGLLDDAEAEREALRDQLRALAGSVLSGDHRSAKALAREFIEADKGR